MPDDTDSSARVDSFLGGGDSGGGAQGLQEGLVNAPASHPAVDVLKKVGWLATELIPQVAMARHRQAVAEATTKAHLQNAMNMHLISTALGMAKEGDAGALQDKDVLKAVKMTMGPAGEGFMAVAGTLAKRTAAHKQGAMELYRQNLAKGLSPVDAQAETIKTARDVGLEIPNNLFNSFVSGTAGPDIARNRATNAAIGRNQVDLSPETTQGKATQAAEVTAARRAAGEPFDVAKENRGEVRSNRRHAQAQADQLSKEERAAASKKLYDKAAKWGFVKPDGTVDPSQHPGPLHTGESAVAAGYAPLDPAEAKAGWMGKLLQGTQFGSAPATTGPNPPQKKTAADILQKYGVGEGQ